MVSGVNPMSVSNTRVSTASATKPRTVRIWYGRERSVWGSCSALREQVVGIVVGSCATR